MAQAGIHVGVDIAGTEFFRQQVIERAGRAVAAEIHHHRKVGLGAGDHRLVHGDPVIAVVVGGFDADHDVGIFLRHRRGGFAVHVGGVLLIAAAPHAAADDVEHRQHAGPGAVDDAVLEILEVAPAGAAGIDHGGDPGAESEAVRRYREVAGIGALLAGAVIDMDMHVDQAWHDIQALHVDGLDRVLGREILRHPGDLAVLDGDVHHRVKIVPGVQDMAAAQEQVVGRKGRRLCRNRDGDEQRRQGCRNQELFHAFTAVQFAAPYSPMSTVPSMRLPLTVPWKL